MRERERELTLGSTGVKSPADGDGLLIQVDSQVLDVGDHDVRLVPGLVHLLHSVPAMRADVRIEIERLMILQVGRHIGALVLVLSTRLLPGLCLGVSGLLVGLLSLLRFLLLLILGHFSVSLSWGILVFFSLLFAKLTNIKHLHLITCVFV